MNRHVLLRLLATALVCALAGSVTPLSAQDLTITNARIIGPNATVIERGSIVVRGGKIASVAAGSPASTSGTVIDAKGMSAMPGFIDGP
jgi:imidazolonepropionase-like amidohydrolase